MKILESVEEFNDPRHPLVLTIGNFDGMHRGHCAILKKVKELAGEEGQSVVITFKNHPSEILRPQLPVKLICSLQHKIRLLQNFPIDHMILIPFTKYLAQHQAASFIENIRQSIPFDHLVLGYDATLGRDKQGDRATMHELGDLWGFTTEYLEQYRYEGQPASSSRIRETLQQGNLQEVEALLGRPYSLYVPVISHEKKSGQTLIIKLNVAGLCLPPSGTYLIHVCINAKLIKGTARLKNGEAESTLEVELQEQGEKPVLDALEVVFDHLEYGDSSPLS